MVEENTSQKIKVKNIDKKIIYFIKIIVQHKLASKKD